MLHSELGEKITSVVQYFSTNPQVFIAAYKSEYEFRGMFKPNSATLVGDEQYIEVYPNPKMDRGFYMLTGDYCSTLRNSRWKWDGIDDIITFAPNCSDNILTIKTGMSNIPPYEFNFSDTISEEQMFQYSTIYDNYTIETLELFEYLKVHCTIPFRMNLCKFNIDNVLELYEDYYAKYN